MSNHHPAIVAAFQRTCLPDPSSITPFAYEECSRELITVNQLIWSLAAYFDLHTAHYIVFDQEPDYLRFGEGWRGYAKLKRDQGFSVTYIALIVRGWWGKSCSSEIDRLTNEKAREAQRGHDRAYWKRMKEANSPKYQARLARMREYSKNKRRAQQLAKLANC
ncbi:hypothetical protein [Aeoliella mucimassa]|uniref:Uncharacterized protein n=1 Tax=Aeoliella mucimassa TaxID=2527972 RepID=A0A518AMG3_9BACT|nr:hypothetical protein [Aeoliella mucimassa]QDU55919.1 hypothetical protein Pan181_21210 [Aeoliella mucimassa]